MSTLLYLAFLSLLMFKIIPLPVNLTLEIPNPTILNVFEFIQAGKPGERKRIRCSVCVGNPDTVKRFCYLGRQPAICTIDGAIARTDTISNHLDNLSTISKVQSALF